jgi:putative oxidoreductase
MLESGIVMRLHAARDPAFVIRFSVALLFIMFGFDKFDARPNSEWVSIFARIGLGQWFRVVTGWVEIAGGILLLPRATSRAGATILGATMLGAAVAHLTVLGDPLAALVPLILGGIAVATGLHQPEYDVRAFTLRHRGERSTPSASNSRGAGPGDA